MLCIKPSNGKNEKSSTGNHDNLFLKRKDRKKKLLDLLKFILCWYRPTVSPFQFLIL